MTGPAPSAISRQEVEEFLYGEASLLDNWRLDEWLALFCEDARYLVPIAGAPEDSDPENELFYINDDHFLLSERIHRLQKDNAHAEFPHSLCRRLVTNVRILRSSKEHVEVASNFLTFRTKAGKTDTYFGHHKYEIVPTNGGLRIRRKMSFIDQHDLYEQAKISIII